MTGTFCPAVPLVLAIPIRGWCDFAVTRAWPPLAMSRKATANAEGDRPTAETALVSPVFREIVGPKLRVFPVRVPITACKGPGPYGPGRPRLPEGYRV